MQRVTSEGAVPKKRLWIFYQDESVFKAYDGARKRWMPPDFVGRLLKKGEGPGIMITAFVNEQVGWLKLTRHDLHAINAKRAEEGKPPCKYFTDHNGYYYAFHAFEYGKARQGYWDGDKMIEQVDEIIDAFNHLHPEDQALFIFDHSSGHAKYPEDALNANNMNMKYGGTKGCNMRATTLEEDYLNSNIEVEEELDDGIWSEPRPYKKCDVQHMVFQERDDPPFYAPYLQPQEYVGKPKGIRQVLWERGLLKADMSLEGRWIAGPGNKPMRGLSTSARHRLSLCPDFLHQKSALQLKVEAAGHLCEFLPKYHPELNPIELCWGWIKRWMRKRCKYKYESMLKNLPITMIDVLPLRVIHNYCRHARNYMNVYLQGAKTGREANKMMKLYKSHRRPAPSELNPGKVKYKPYGKIKEETMDDIGLGRSSGAIGTTKVNLKSGVSKETLMKIKEKFQQQQEAKLPARIAQREALVARIIEEDALVDRWHLDDEEEDIEEGIRMETEEENDDDDDDDDDPQDDNSEDHDEFDVADKW